MILRKNNPNPLIKSSLQQQEEVASSSEGKEHNDTSSLRRKLSFINTTPPPEGLSVRCIEEPKRVFHWTGTELRHYPSGKIASSWDPEWRDVAPLQCEGLTIGSPMSFNYGALPLSNRRNKLKGRAMPDDRSDPGVLVAEVSAAVSAVEESSNIKIKNVEDKMSVYMNVVKEDMGAQVGKAMENSESNNRIINKLKKTIDQNASKLEKISNMYSQSRKDIDMMKNLMKNLLEDQNLFNPKMRSQILKWLNNPK
jgi:hypothetical protein